MNTALFTSVFGSRVRLRPAKDAFESQYGVMVEFLDEDGSIRDFEGLERVDALVMALCLSAMATADLISDKAMELYAEAFDRMEGEWTPENMIPFMLPGKENSTWILEGHDVAGNKVIERIYCSTTTEATTPPAPPQAGGSRGLESPRSIAQAGMPASPVEDPAL